eukprot:5620105-Pyramimonas_sp.AAC.1
MSAKLMGMRGSDHMGNLGHDLFDRRALRTVEAKRRGGGAASRCLGSQRAPRLLACGVQASCPAGATGPRYQK